MSRVMIDCPKAGGPVYTHLNFEEFDWDAIPVGARQIECPQCGEMHSWRRADAYLEEDGGTG
jgi:uncharacterized protein (UPF0212 family)